MRVLIGGASGMIGSALAARLEERGDTVLRLVRRPPRGGHEIGWDPVRGILDDAALAAGGPVDAVVNLSGASISRMPWTNGYRREILASRLGATTTLARWIRGLPAAEPLTFVSASGSGFYGSRPAEMLTETAAKGDGFLADVVEQWEAAATAAEPAARVVTVRTGIVLGPHGALAPLTTIAKLGLAGPIGGGRQVWPWIALADEVAAIMHALDTPALSGPVNLASPESATAARIVRELAAQLHRPYLLPLPAFAVRTLLGQAGTELLLADQHLVPRALTDSGFVFTHPSLPAAVAAALPDR